MKPKMMTKICVDIGMTVALLFLMAYEMVEQAAHEWLGIGMFVLFVVHHILNGKWSGNLLKGHYTPLRIWQTLLVVLVLLCMTGSMVSGVILSRNSAYDFRLLGLCVDVAASGTSLERDDGNGEESIPKGLRCPHMGAADDSHSDCRVWCVRLCKTGNWKLYAFENPVCIF